MSGIQSNAKVFKWSALALAVSALVACGGGGGGGSAPQTFTATGTKGPLNGATVTGTGLTCTTSNAAGASTCTVNEGATGPFVVSFTGGSYCTNEAQVGSGCATVNFGGVLRTVSPAGTNVRATPFTEAALQNANGNAAGFAAAYAALATRLGIPSDPAVDPFSNTQASSLLVSFAQALAQGVTLETAIDRVQAGQNPQTGQPVPTSAPTAAPTSAPTAAPTSAPTAAPTSAPTAAPTTAPTAAPTSAPTAAPTSAPTAAPTPAPAPSTVDNTNPTQPCPTGTSGTTGVTGGGTFFDQNDQRFETCTVRTAG